LPAVPGANSACAGRCRHRGTMRPMSRQVAEILIGWGKLAPQALDRAVSLERGSGERVDVILTRLGLAPQADAARARAQALDLALAEPGDYPEAPVLADKVTTAFLRRARVLPLADRPDALILAMVDPEDRYAREAIQLLVAKPVQPVVAVPAELERA